MIGRKMIGGLAVAASMAGGLGAYGAASAFAATTASSTPASSPKPTPSASPTSRDAMIRHCTDHMPAGERAKARQQMQHMMSGDSAMMSGGTTGSSMMGDTSDSGAKG